MMTATINTRDGGFLASYSELGLVTLQFPNGFRGPVRHPICQRNPQVKAQRWMELTRHALERLLNGKQPSSLPELDITGCTRFQQAVWCSLIEIPLGETRSYQDIARSIGRPTASRAVGGACAANPIPLIIPCHRVLAANGRLGGFSAGLGWKSLLLRREGHRPERFITERLAHARPWGSPFPSMIHG